MPKDEQPSTLHLTALTVEPETKFQFYELKKLGKVKNNAVLVEMLIIHAVRTGFNSATAVKSWKEGK